VGSLKAIIRCSRHPASQRCWLVGLANGSAEQPRVKRGPSAVWQSLRELAATMCSALGCRHSALERVYEPTAGPVRLWQGWLWRGRRVLPTGHRPLRQLAQRVRAHVWLEVSRLPRLHETAPGLGRLRPLLVRKLMLAKSSPGTRFNATRTNAFAVPGERPTSIDRTQFLNRGLATLAARSVEK
jgi:hypothetical protein